MKELGEPGIGSVADADVVVPEEILVGGLCSEGGLRVWEESGACGEYA